MSALDPNEPVEERRGSFALLALFLAAGLAVFVFVWMTVQRRPDQAAFAGGPMRSSYEIGHWLKHGWLASYGLLAPSADERQLYRWSTGGYMLSGFVVEKIHVALTGRYDWRLLALHNELVALLTSALLALLAYRLARRAGVDPSRAFVLGVAVEVVHFTFPGSLSLYWEMTAQAAALPAAIAFLLLEERAIDRGRTRRVAILQALAIFVVTTMEPIYGTLFIAVCGATLLLVRGERPPLRRLAAVLLLPWAAALAIYALQLGGAKLESRRGNVTFAGSGFLYRSGLDGDATLYGDHLDIAFGRDVVRAGLPNSQYLFRWPWLFLAGAAALLATLLAYLRGRAPRGAVVALAALTGAYLLYAALFSQAVALHPYHYDLLLATPLILALFAIVPVLAEGWTRHTGLIVLVALFAAAWLAMFQLRLYALGYAHFT
jgi:hypothetical protein